MQVIGEKPKKSKKPSPKKDALINQPFDTQISQQHPNHSQDKGFSPWINQKKNNHFEKSPQDIDYHHFLAKIKLSPKVRNKLMKNGSQETNDQLQTLKADLTGKMKAQKISNGQFIEEKLENRITQYKNFFQRRANLTKMYKRPKSIDLSLQFQPRVMFNASPIKVFRNLPNSVQIFKLNARNQTKIIHKLRKKKNIGEEGKEFSQTVKDFRLNILNSQKKVHHTIQINITQIFKKNKNQIGLTQVSKTTNMFNRPKYLKPKSEKHPKIFDDTLACLGKNAYTVEHKTCRDKIRSQLKNVRNQVDQAFVI